MIQKFFSKYGLSTHLAVLAALPLALVPFLSASVLASVVFWLIALAAVWLLVEPSVRLGEHLSQARARVRHEIFRDILFWILLALVLVALIRWLNSGIGLFWDAERGTWTVHEPAFPVLPASVGDEGLLPFALSLAALTVLMGLRHGVGLHARTEFGLVGAFVSGLGGAVAVGFAAAAIGGADSWVGAGFEDPPFWSSMFGVWMILGIVCGIQGEVQRWGVSRLAIVFAVAGNTAALLFFAPPLVAASWILFSLLTTVFGLCYLSRASSMGAVARSMSLLLIGFALPVFAVMTFMGDEARTLKLRHLAPACALEPREADVEAAKIVRAASSVLDGRKAAERVRGELLGKAKERKVVLNRLAKKMWKDAPWTGAGLGAYGVRAQFLAEREDWKSIPLRPTCTPNGYWSYLSERGVLGVSLVIVLIGVLLFTYVARFSAAFRFLRHNDDADIFIFAVAPLAWVGPFCVAGLFVEAGFSPVFTVPVYILMVTIPLTLSASAFPKPKKTASAEGASAPISEN